MLRPHVRIFLISTVTCKHYLLELKGEDHQEKGSDYSVSQSSQGSQGECGRSNPKRARILGGKHVQRNEFPWHVLLTWPGSIAPCGGSILTTDKILTAAHCTVKAHAKSITVWTGLHDYTKKNEGMKHSVCNKTEHPEFGKIKRDKDIAILHLCQPLKFSKGKFQH